MVLGGVRDLDSPTMIPQALTNPISFFRATPPPPEPASASGLVSDPLSPGWFFEVLFRCRAPFSIFFSPRGFGSPKAKKSCLFLNARACTMYG